MLTFIGYLEIYFTFAFLDCARYKEDFVRSRSGYIEVMFHIFYRNFGRTAENRSLYRGSRYKEVR